MKSQIAMPIAIVVILIAVIIPLPTVILDVLISSNIALSVVILLAAVYLLNPLQFSSFPSILLMSTLFRLSLNIASTRLILLNGSRGMSAAGEVIRAFGQFVVGCNYAVGIVIFLVLIVIQYVVINHGAVRISEVTARFTLDALPGKQLAVDADLNAGIIDQQEARERRAEIGREAEFHGAMDGAIRFTQRDAVASILITLINIIGGLFIGVFQFGMPVASALTTFTVLTIGDGLVTAIPSLLISIAGGLVTTRAASDLSLGQEVSLQLFSNPNPLDSQTGRAGSWPHRSTCECYGQPEACSAPVFDPAERRWDSPRRVDGRQVSGDQSGQCDRNDSGHPDNRTHIRPTRILDYKRQPRTRPDAQLHSCRSRDRPGDTFGGDHPQPCLRASRPSRSKGAHRLCGRNAPEACRRAGSEDAFCGRHPESSTKPAA